MPLPMGSYVPGPRFAAPRSYWRGIRFNITGYVVTNVANVYFWTKIIDPNEVWTITLDNRFHMWNSNRWTLDFIITTFYYQIFPDPTRHDMPFELSFDYSPNNHSPYLSLRFDSTTFPDFHYFEFPPAPSGYWAPHWLPGPG